MGLFDLSKSNKISFAITLIELHAIYSIKINGQKHNHIRIVKYKEAL